jgi:hypothetical protein
MIIGSVSGWLMLRDDGAAARNFAAHEFRRDFMRDGGAEVLAGMLAAHQVGQLFTLRAGFAQVVQIHLTLHVLADGNVFHFRRDDAFACIVHLADIHSRLGATWLAMQTGEAQCG